MPFTWGYFLGLCRLCCGVFALVILVLTPFVSHDQHEKGQALVGCLIIIAAWGLPGLFVIKRRAWAWVLLTVVSFNPVLWVANHRFGRNRWPEWRREGGMWKMSEVVTAGVGVGGVCLLIAWASNEDASAPSSPKRFHARP